MLKIFTLFSKNKFSNQNQKTAEDSILSLRSRMNILNQKSFNLTDNFPEQKKAIEECFNLFNLIQPSSSVRAGKFEQQIAVEITKVSTYCDQVFSTKDSKKLSSEINTLKRVIRERQNADIAQEE